MKKVAAIAVIALLFASSCSNKGDGQLVGVKDRPDVLDLTPFGMVYIPAGHYLMGPGDQDVLFASTSQSKSVNVDAFWMDQTEITNNEYRQFVCWVRDSLAHVLLGE
ncbi:MAG: SUMF1/EgtB/PvdO family nonheme iron enzyme, partial [Bacteroidales bacterium]|nr:SUMF1/EgtB/PvdO family nonheme iron enzyme [Bacteroidales bacterium]